MYLSQKYRNSGALLQKVRGREYYLLLYIIIDKIIKPIMDFQPLPWAFGWIDSLTWYQS